MALMLDLIFQSLNILKFNLNLARNWMGDSRLAVMNLISVKLFLGPFFFFPTQMESSALENAQPHLQSGTEDWAEHGYGCCH